LVDPAVCTDLIALVAGFAGRRQSPRRAIPAQVAAGNGDPWHPQRLPQPHGARAFCQAKGFLM